MPTLNETRYLTIKTGTNPGARIRMPMAPPPRSTMPPCPTMVQLTLNTAARPTALTATTRRLATASRSPPRDTDTDTAPKLALTDPTVNPLRALTANPTVVPKLRLPLLMPLHGRLLSRSLTTVTTPGPSRPTVKTRTPG